MSILEKALEEYGYSKNLINKMVNKHQKLNYKPQEIYIKNNFKDTNNIIFNILIFIISIFLVSWSVNFFYV